MRDYRLRFGGGGRDVFDDEDLLAWSHETELAAGDFFDGGWIFPQPTRLFSEPGIFGALAGNRRRELVVLAPGPQRRQQPTLADQAVDNDHGSDKQQQQMGDSATSPWLFCLSGSACRRWSASVFRHP
jgi:hypothetical protein